MRVRMLQSMPVTVDGVSTLDLEDGNEYELGDAVGADLVRAGSAEQVEAHSAAKSRGGRKKADEDKADAKADGGASENKDDGPADEDKADPKPKLGSKGTGA